MKFVIIKGFRMAKNQMGEEEKASRKREWKENPDDRPQGIKRISGYAKRRREEQRPLEA